MISLSFICLHSSLLAMENSAAQKPADKVIDQIRDAMTRTMMHDECHVNIFRLATILRDNLLPDDFDKVSVAVLKPKEGKYLANSLWFYHVVLVYDDQVFDFFHCDKSKKYENQNYQDYFQENYFDFRHKLSSIIWRYQYNDYFRHGFRLVDIALNSDLTMIGEANITFDIKVSTISANDYLECVSANRIDHSKIETSPSFKLTHEVFDRRNYLEFYKRRYSGTIRQCDEMLIICFFRELYLIKEIDILNDFIKQRRALDAREDLTEEQKEIRDLCLRLEAFHYDFRPLREGLLKEFAWPELQELDKKWQGQSFIDEHLKREIAAYGAGL